MPFIAIEIPPGVVKADSEYASSGRWIDCNHVRFVKGRPEKLGGVIKLFPEQFTGIARAARAWLSFNNTQCLVWGTACGLFLRREGATSDITPYRVGATAVTLGTDPFAVVDTETEVTVTDSAHGITDVGTIVTFSGATAGGGITIDGDYAVTSIPDVNTFTIEHSTPATSTDSATGGASVEASYTLNCGDVDPTYLLGWGVGGWGVGGWGVPASIASAKLPEPADWSLDVYGEDLVVCPLNGTIYIYDTSTGATRPAALANAPAQIRSTFVTEERYIFALGCTLVGGSVFDPMTVRWADILDPTIWTPASTNRANQRKLQGGTRLMGGTRLGQAISMVWSDSNAFLFQFTGGSTTYSSRSVGENCGLVGQHAFTTAGGVAFWMSSNSFYRYAGYVEEIPNVDDIKDYVFKDINTEHMSKSFSYFDPTNNEVWFIYPSAMATECDRYVMVSLEAAYPWVHGTWDRSAAARYTSGETRPILLGQDGYAYIHDVIGNGDEDGEILDAYIEMAPTDVDGGNTLVDIFGVVPDCERQTGDIELTITTYEHPRDQLSTEVLTIEETDSLVDARVSGRHFKAKFRSNEIGGDFRLGKWGLEISGAGKKRGSQA